MATTTIENYVKEIFFAEQESPGNPVPMGTIAKALNVVPGTATTMVKSMERNELLEYKPRIGVTLKNKGRTLAIRMIRRHRLIEVFLVNVLKLDWDEIHEDAEELEHVVSDRILEKIDELCGYPEFDPHGDPIPSANGTFKPVKHKSLMECPTGRQLTIQRVLDQKASFLKFAMNSGLTPGANIQVIERNSIAEAITVLLDHGRQLSLGAKVAEKILVA
jgi:DtxR family Mn-dependent transcriptional regulator